MNEVKLDQVHYVYKSGDEEFTVRVSGALYEDADVNIDEHLNGFIANRAIRRAREEGISTDASTEREDDE